MDIITAIVFNANNHRINPLRPDIFDGFEKQAARAMRLTDFFVEITVSLSLYFTAFYDNFKEIS